LFVVASWIDRDNN